MAAAACAPGPPVPADDLAAWIDELRRRLDAGGLAGRPPIDLGNALTLTNLERAAQPGMLNSATRSPRGSTRAPVAPGRNPATSAMASGPR